MATKIYDVAQHDGYIFNALEETLSDGSKVYDLTIEDDENFIRLHCTDKKKAQDLFYQLTTL